jgi:hypothetical protein
MPAGPFSVASDAESCWLQNSAKSTKDEQATLGNRLQVGNLINARLALEEQERHAAKGAASPTDASPT